MKPSRIHYFFAKDWPSRLWLIPFPVFFIFWFASPYWRLFVYPLSWSDPLLFLGIVIIVAFLGYLVGVLVGWPIIGPMYHSRSIENGEPFQCGEKVYILTGPYKDRVVTVVDTYDDGYAGGYRIRVDLEGGEDVFKSIEILRVSSLAKES